MAKIRPREPAVSRAADRAVYGRWEDEPPTVVERGDLVSLNLFGNRPDGAVLEVVAQRVGDLSLCGKATESHDQRVELRVVLPRESVDLIARTLEWANGPIDRGEELMRALIDHRGDSGWHQSCSVATCAVPAWAAACDDKRRDTG